MSIILSKLIPVFLYPLGCAIVLILLGLLLILFRKRLSAGLVLAVCLGLLWIPSMPVVSESLLRTLEMDLPAQPIADASRADAVVVLAGGVASVHPGSLAARPEHTFDRLYNGYLLYKAGKAPLLVLSGGSISWKVKDEARAESELMAQLLQEVGVPKSSILVEAQSRNTFENAKNTAELLHQRGLDRILLSTSALHMPRAMACFEQTGLDVVPVPADYLVDVQARRDFLDYLPDVQALAESTAVLKEYLGIMYYTSRGWIDIDGAL
jgi:uncharacterized SAM-binding protein YcdF (DUF218 family)